LQDDEAYQDAADHGGQGEDGGAVADGTEVKKRVFLQFGSSNKVCITS
jgi:hypothetical protein